MKKISVLLLFVLLGSSIFSIAVAQTASSQEEKIIYFSSDIAVNADDSINVTETIIYDSGGQDRHGIYRDIDPYSSQDRKMAIENVSVTDQDGNPYAFQTSYSGKNFRIKIGDPDRTFNGQKTYVIRYRATKAVGQLQNFDEIYWNVTGNGWNIPIYGAQANISLPGAAKSIQSACYFGPQGSGNKCDTASDMGGLYSFRAPSTLGAKEGFTVAVGFAKGIVSPYSAADAPPGFIEKYWPWFFAIFLPVLTLVLSLWYWYKKGRDPKGTGVIVPQYDVPDELTPMEVGGIIKEKIDPKNISAEIIYLATKGYLKISQTEKLLLGLFKSTDYELVKLKDFSSLPNGFDRNLLDSLFDFGSGPVKLSSLKNVFYKEVPKITKLLKESLLSKGYYKYFGKIFYFNSAKTEKGVATKEYILGLKDYLRIAEKDRLLFHNAPGKKPEVFEKLLPYAMVLGVADIWAKEFEDIYTVPPTWYSGPEGAAFNAIAFNHSISDFSNFASASLVSAPGGGSGGGGSSGGGGGGGGGGGW